MTRFIARCPQCRTAFRIRPDQLEVADGLVRCGACLSVFAAAEHRLSLKDEGGPDDAAIAMPADGAAAMSVEDRAGESPDPPLVAEEQSVAIADEAREIVAADADLGPPLESLAGEAAPESEQAAAEPQSAEKAAATEEAPPTEGAARDRPASAPRAFVDVLEDEDGLGAIGRDELASLDAAPIEMEAARPARRGRAALWLSANLVLALLLAGQVAWTRFDDLLANPRYRPALEFLCRHAGCALATFRDLAAIESEELSVRSHPARPGALQVDFIFRNNADLAQDFPLVELNFHDLGGRLLANRLFTPAEYLADGLRALEKMPARVPVQVKLELLDPGPEAVNYSLAFRLP